MKELIKDKSISKMFKGIVKSFDEKTHRATIFISTGDVDRDNEVIEPKAFQKHLGNYLAHPVLLSSHRADQLTRQIGEAIDIKITQEGVEGDYLWYVGKGNPEADWGWFLVTRGIAAFSVGFMAKTWLDKWTEPMISSEDMQRGVQRRFTEIELLENSQVLVPANQNALQRRISETEGAEKELLELVVKKVTDEDMKPFDVATKDELVVTVTLDKALAEFVDMLKADPSLVEEIKKLIEHKKNHPKHYSEVLLGAGDADPIQTPTKGTTQGDAGSVKQNQLNTNEIIGAVKNGVKEGLKT
jgi:hypothetical protein